MNSSSLIAVTLTWRLRARNSDGSRVSVKVWLCCLQELRLTWSADDLTSATSSPRASITSSPAFVLLLLLLPSVLSLKPETLSTLFCPSPLGCTISPPVSVFSWYYCSILVSLVCKTVLLYWCSVPALNKDLRGAAHHFIFSSLF